MDSQFNNYEPSGIYISLKKGTNVQIDSVLLRRMYETQQKGTGPKKTNINTGATDYIDQYIQYTIKIKKSQ